MGYKTPPIECQFKKGQSGNPNGRPKGSKNLSTILKKVLNEKVTITEGNKKEIVTKQEALIKSLLANSLSGNNGATVQALKLIQQMEDSGEYTSTSYLKEDGSVISKNINIEKLLESLGE